MWFVQIVRYTSITPYPPGLEHAVYVAVERPQVSVFPIEMLLVPHYSTSEFGVLIQRLTLSDLFGANRLRISLRDRVKAAVNPRPAKCNKTEHMSRLHSFIGLQSLASPPSLMHAADVSSTAPRSWPTGPSQQHSCVQARRGHPLHTRARRALGGT